MSQITEEQPEQWRQTDQRLLDAIKARVPELERLRLQFTLMYEDRVSRFYHSSSKVYSLQDTTLQAVAIFKNIADAIGARLCELFEQIIEDGTGQIFEPVHNANWPRHTRPMVEAFLHTKYFWEMMIKYAQELESAPALLPDGWAAILELYNQR